MLQGNINTQYMYMIFQMNQLHDSGGPFLNFLNIRMFVPFYCVDNLSCML
jgi:hypothetical protein